LAIIGNPWTNTIAADRAGEALYADVSVVPHVSTEKLDACGDQFISGQINATGFAAALNGSKSECEWGSDDDAPEDGIFGDANLPKLRNREYVGNSNDSYWLSNPDDLTTGFSVMVGGEEYSQSLRTRQGFTQAEARMAATDGKSDTPGYNLELLQDMLYSNMSLSEQLTRDDVVSLWGVVGDGAAGDCDPDEDGDQPYSENPAVAATACGILQNWDGLFSLESVGTAVWKETWNRLRSQVTWVVPFDAADPVNTPNTLDVDDPAVIEATRCSIGGAVDRLVTAEVPLDRPWGEAQFRATGDGEGRTPLPGGPSSSAFSIISSNLVDGEGYSDIPAGNSYIHTVTWDDTQCPDAFAVLTYSQSVNPASPHYADMTELYSAGGWNDMPFCPEDVEAEKISETEVSTN
jgi:acyl-homoserine-lactone acylase